jgi:phage-related protein
MPLSLYRAELGGIVFGDTGPNGEQWIVTNLEGWHSQASTGEVTPREARNGGWRNRATFAPKGLTLDGAIYTPNGNVGDLMDLLVGAIPLDDPQPLTVYGVTSDDRFISVRQEGSYATQIVTPYEALFSIGLVAPDPLKYSATEHALETGLPVSSGGLTVPHVVPFTVDSVSISGTMEVFNAGNATTAPRLIIYGPVDTPRVTNVTTGETLTVALVLEAGEYLDIDLEAHTAMLGGTSSRRGFISGSWWKLVKGNNTLSFNASVYHADAALQVIWRDAWK